MKEGVPPAWISLWISALLLVLAGCAAKIPATIPLPESGIPFILGQLEDFQSRCCKLPLDADVTLEWEVFGKTEKIPGMLQLESPSFLRYTVAGPLGRQLLILVSDGTSFTLVDNRKGEALIGQVDSPFWRRYIPPFITPEECMDLLTGSISPASFEVREFRQDEQSKDGVWLVSGWKKGVRHHVLFYPRLSRVTRHIVEGEGRDILLDVIYSDFAAGDSDCARPHLLHAEGERIHGDLTVHFDTFYPQVYIPASSFQINPPPHFTVKTVDE